MLQARAETASLHNAILSIIHPTHTCCHRFAVDRWLQRGVHLLSVTPAQMPQPPRQTRRLRPRLTTLGPPPHLPPHRPVAFFSPATRPTRCPTLPPPLARLPRRPLLAWRARLARLLRWICSAAPILSAYRLIAANAWIVGNPPQDVVTVFGRRWAYRCLSCTASLTRTSCSRSEMVTAKAVLVFVLKLTTREAS